MKPFHRHIRFCLQPVFFVVINFSCLFSQQYDINFERISLEHGLSQSTVLSILQDDEGFMWIGTIDGLNKYDGYDFTIFRNDPADPNSLSENWITSTYLDRNGFLWIGTLTGKLNKLDLKNYEGADNKFTSFCLTCDSTKVPPLKEALTRIPFIYSSLNYNSITSICEDKDGNLWLGTFGSGIFKFDTATETMIANPVSLPGLCNYVMTICLTFSEKSHIIWLGTYGGGLIKISKNEHIQFFQHDPLNARSLSENQIMTIYKDPSGLEKLLWIGTLSEGLELFNTESEQFTHYKNDPFNRNSLGGHCVLSILKDRNGTLWAGTLENGLNMIRFQGNIGTAKEKIQVSHYYNNPSNPNSLGSNEVLSLYEDRSGIMWVGTNLGGGLNKFDRRSKKFTHFKHDHSNPNSISENVIFSLFEDSDGYLWIGSFKKGLDKYDHHLNKFTHYRTDPNNPFSLSDNCIRAIYEDKYNTLWIGTFRGGLCKFDQQKNRFKMYRHNPADSTSLSFDYVWSIFEDKYGDFWVGTKGGGLNKFDRDTEKFTRYQHNPINPVSLSDNRVILICEGPAEFSLWIATFGGGLNRFDLRTEKFIHYYNESGNPNSLGDNRVMSILKDPTDSTSYWIGTYGGGLNRLQLLELGDVEDRYIITRYTKQHGLPNNVVYGILDDEKGNLWPSTNKGISKFNTSTQKFTNYDITYGLQSYEFNACAYYKGPATGEMYFGGVNGLNSFCPEKAQINRTIPPIVLTSFKIFDEEIHTALSTGTEIDLSYDDNFFSFEFSALDYTDQKKNQYAYKLEGLNENWVNCGSRRYVSYTNLDPGDYIFRVKGSNSDGIWNDEGTYIKIKIHPPYWKTWWFYTVTLVLIIGSAILFYNYQLRVNIKRSLEVERIRNSENERVRKSVAADFHDELGQKLTKISLFSEILKRKLNKTSPEILDYIDKIINAAKELSRSTRDFIWTINPSQDSLHDVVVYLKDFGDEMFDKTGIKFRANGISKELEQILLPMEWRRHVTLIFKEAMNNVLKHSKSKNVDFNIALNHTKINIILQDDGIGYSAKKNSTGHGLQNMKTRANLIESDIFITSNNNKGTTIRFSGEIPRTGY